jgi:hypothetical protein
MNGGWQDAAWAASKDRLADALRLVLCITLIEAALWTPTPVAVLCLLLSLGYMARHLWKRANRASAHGMELRGLLNSSGMIGGTFLLAAVILAFAHYSGSLHSLWGLRHPWFAVPVYACWAFVQEFMLQCFCLRLLRALLSRAGSLLMTAGVFAVAHLPNPGLTLLTFFAGICFSTLYARRRNLFLVAFIHAVLGLTLAVSAPESWFHELRVGRDFLSAPVTYAASSQRE